MDMDIQCILESTHRTVTLSIICQLNTSKLSLSFSSPLTGDYPGTGLYSLFTQNADNHNTLGS